MNILHSPPPSRIIAAYYKLSQLLEPRPDWYSTQLPALEIQQDAIHTLPPELLQSIKDYAEEVLAQDASQYEISHISTSSDHKFMSTVMQTGTWSDKVSALTLVVQESPLHTHKYFGNLVNLAGKRSRDNALAALAALKDLLANGHLLPKERKLRHFGKQPGLLTAFQGVKKWNAGDELPRSLTKEHLVYWAYEDRLKRSYFEILRLLESWSGDAVENARTRSLDFVFELLKEKPEQEENLLRLLVNKLGDTNKKIASKASHRILQLETSHPSMKSIIVSVVESEILFKPGQSNHAKYYAAITLNQTALSTGDPDTADKLLDVYFGVFVTLLNKHNIKSPDANKALQNYSEESGQKRKRTPKPSSLPDDSNNPEKQLEDKLVAQILTGIHRAFPYTSQDNFEKLESHIQTLFSITHSSNFGTSLRALILLQTITSSHSAVTSSTNIRDRYMRTLYESLLDPRLITATGKHTMYFNLLYRSLKNDSSINRVKAFIKRLLQICSVHEPPFIVSVVFLIQELGKALPGLRSMATQAEPAGEESDEDEVFYDAPDSDDERPKDRPRLPTDNQSQTQARKKPVRIVYDARKRDPTFAHAEMSSLWDAIPYMQHYHPSVSLFASSFLPSADERSPPKPDPSSHTLIHFLDRFAYRNPKAPRDASSGDPKALRGSSLMQPALASTGTTDHFIATGGDLQPALHPVSSEQFWQKRAEEVAPEDVFFHRYFSAIGPSKKAARDRKRADQAAGTAGIEADFDGEIGAGEDEIWRALVSSRPELESEGSEEDADDGHEAEEDGEFSKAMMSDGDDDVDGDEGVVLNLESDDEDDDDGKLGDAPQAKVNGDMDKTLDAELEGVDNEDEIWPADEEDDSEEEDEEAEGSLRSDESKSRRAKRRKLSSLPTFASVDDYAKMIEDAEADEDSS